jgi:ribosome-binding factor A
LALESGKDDALSGIIVVRVEPAPDTTRLLVTVTAPCQVIHDPVGVLETLKREAPRLRYEVASAITRRRAPLLAFQLCLPTRQSQDA